MAKKFVNVTVNGEALELAASPGGTLINALRDQFGLIGAKPGCDSGGCGCCSVLIDGQVRYSCMVFTQSLESKSVTTVEGLESAEGLNALQQAFVDSGAVQCGYCTCGIIMAAHALLTTNPFANEDEVRKGISGCLCRCTGYHKIVQAILAAAPAYKNQTIA